MERSVGGGQNRDEEQSARSQPTKLDARYPTPEFMRLLVELGRIIERRERDKELPDNVTRTDVPPED